MDNSANPRNQCEELEPFLREEGVVGWADAYLSPKG